MSRRPLAAVTCVVLLGLTVVATAPPTSASTSGRRLSVLHLVDQTLVVAPGAVASFDVSVNGLPPDATLVATVYLRLASPQQGVTDALDGRIKAGSVGSPLSFPLADLPRHNEHVTLSIPTVVALKDAKAGLSVRLATAGIYPVRIEARSADDEPLNQLLTFVVRLDDPAKPATLPRMPLTVAVVLPVDAPPSLQPDGSTVIDGAARGRVAALAELLADQPTAPLTVALPPEMMDALSRSSDATDVALVAGLRSSLGDRQLLARPYVHMDPATAARSHLEREFTDQLVRGEEVLSRQFPGAQPDRTSWLVDDPIDGDGLRLLRGLGVHQLVVPSRLLQTRPSSARATVTGFVRTSAGGDSPTFDVAVTDDSFSVTLTTTDDPVLATEQLLVKLIALRLELPDDARTYGVVLMPRSADLPDRQVMSTLMRGLTGTKLLTPSTVGQFVRAAAPDGSATLTAASVPDLSQHATALADARTYITNTESMETTATHRTGRDLLGVASATNIDASTRAAYVNTARAQVDFLRHAIVAQPRNTITLAGQVKRVTVTVHSSITTPVQVRLHLASSGNKIVFPENDRLITIENGGWKDQIAVAPRTNGAIAVSLQLLTPVGNEVVGQQDLDVRVVGLSGLGIVLSGGALLVLATWWIHHLRRRSRTKLAASSVNPS